MNAFITVRIKRPEEGYSDVCDELVLADFLETPKAFEVELVPSDEEIEELARQASKKQGW